MELDFNELIKELKTETTDYEAIKKDILILKRTLNELYGDCKEDFSTQEIVEHFIEEYEKELEFRGDSSQIFNKMLMYSSYKRLIQYYRANKGEFDSVLKEAKSRELRDDVSPIVINVNMNESMVSVIRYLIRSKKISKEKDIIDAIKGEKSNVGRELRRQMMYIIDTSVQTLNYYGFLDKYIVEVNEELVQLGLNELQYEKRNPVPDKQFDENGKVVKDVEDPGIIELLDEENLEQIPIENLVLLAASWESEYFVRRLDISKAIEIIKTLDLWDKVLNGDDDEIVKLPETDIDIAEKKELALSFLCKTKSEITDKMRKQYKSFLEQEGMSSDLSLDEEVENSNKDFMNLKCAAADVTVLQCLILQQIKEKNIKIKNWGLVDGIGVEDSDDLTIVIEDEHYRGPLIIPISKQILTSYFESEELDFPKYNKKINERYCMIMSKLYLPTNKYFMNLIKQAYKKNPQSQLFADLVGKKVQESKIEER